MFKLRDILKKIRPPKTVRSSVVVLDKNSLLYFDEANDLQLDIPENVVVDLEVINYQKFLELVTSFIKENNISTDNIFMVINSSLFFEKELDGDNVNLQTAEFLEKVPFDDISSKLISIDSGSKLLATNKAFFTPIRRAFTDEGLHISLVLPYFALEKHNFDVKEMVGSRPKKDFYQKLKLLEQYNLLPADKAEKVKKVQKKKMYVNSLYTQQSKGNKEKTEKSTLPVLLSAFGILVLVLVGLLLFNAPHKTVPEKKGAVSSNLLTDGVKKQTADGVTDNIAVKTEETTTVKIIYSSANLQSTTALTGALSPEGFKNITLENTASENNTPKTVIAFSSNYPQKLRDKIVSETNKLFNDVSIQDQKDSDADVVITIGGQKQGSEQ